MTNEMTYIDRYMELHPSNEREAVMRHYCPNEKFNIPSEPNEYCVFSQLHGGTNDCRYCWQRTYRGEDERSVCE